MCVCLISAYEKLEINYEKVCEYVITVITTRVQSWIKHFAQNSLKIYLKFTKNLLKIYLKLGGRKCSVTLSRKRQKL